ncbi:MAG: hypothetical protein LBV09_03470 [Deferribacteraceae bacterium]|nr:hypothetical protein [Deferribacteraceae bacterium]
MQEFGLAGGLQYYAYDSDIEAAAGFIASIDWQFARDFGLYLAYENAWITEGSTERAAYAIEGKLSMYVTDSLILSGLVESGDENEYVDDFRWGAQVRYAF